MHTIIITTTKQEGLKMNELVNQIIKYQQKEYKVVKKKLY